MRQIINSSGLIQQFYTKAEQAETWKELDVDLSPVGKNVPLYTPRDNKEYFIISETETSYQKYTAVIRANGKTKQIKYNICNEQDVTYKAVRSLYN